MSPVGGWWDNSPSVPYAWWGVIPPWQGHPYYWGDYIAPSPHHCPHCCGAHRTITTDRTTA